MVFEQRPFYRTLECVGTLSSEDVNVSDLQFEIEYSEADSGEIRAAVIGSEADVARISQLDLGGTLQLEAKRARGSRRIEVTSNSVTITSLNRGFAVEEDIVRPIAEFKLLELDVTKQRPDVEGVERKLFYALDGPDSSWRKMMRWTWEDLRDPKIETNEELELGLDLPFDLFISRKPLKDSDPNSEISYKRSVPTLSVETEVPPDKLSTAQFVEKADRVVADLLLLVSFASKQWTVWFRCQLVTSEEIRDRIQTTSRTVRGRDPADNMVPVQPNDIPDFLRSALPEYVDFRDRGSDLRTAIQTTLASREENYVETQFLSLFTALETLKNIFAAREEVEYLLDGGDFNEMKEDLKDVVRQHIGGDDNSKLRSEVYKSMQALNRRSLQSLLNGLLEKYNTGIEDLYPQGTNPSLKRTRNDLVHGRGAPEAVGKLADEVSRLQALINRLILRMLGWEDISQCPPDPVHRRVAKG